MTLSVEPHTPQVPQPPLAVVGGQGAQMRGDRTDDGAAVEGDTHSRKDGPLCEVAHGGDENVARPPEVGDLHERAVRHHHHHPTARDLATPPCSKFGAAPQQAGDSP